MATPSRPLFSLGNLVFVRSEGQSMIGEVVGKALSPYGHVYDVSVEDVVIKAVSGDDVTPVTTDDVQSLLMALLGHAPQTESARDVYLRQRYVEMLTKGLHELKRAESEQDGACVQRFELQQVVAVRVGDAWQLALVHGIARGSDGARYDVEAMDEMRRVGEDALCLLDEVPNGAQYALGERVRFAVEGHEQDDAYLGTLCSLTPAGGEWEYALLFDDGDVLEGLSAQDLIPA